MRSLASSFKRQGFGQIEMSSPLKVIDHSTIANLPFVSATSQKCSDRTEGRDLPSFSSSPRAVAW